jgi:SNF2 family DNA or RNA helicase
VVGNLYLYKDVRRLLIVAPLSILGVWDEEFAKFADFDYTLAVLNGTGAKKADTLRHLSGEPLQVAVVNYESAWRLEQEIMAWKSDMVICDEGHKIKTFNSRAAKALHHIGAAAKYRLLLTGTIITNKAVDVFSQYKFLNPSIFGNSFYSFRNRYFDMVGYGAHTPVLKKTMEPELTRKIHSIAFRATKAECLDLPPITDIIRCVDLEPNAAKLYRDLVKDSYAELDGSEVTATNILTRLLRLSQLTGGFLGGDDDPKPQNISKAKLDALSDIIETAQEGGQKLVIIARFIAEIAAIKALLEKQGIQYSAINGETKDRPEQVKRFQQDPNVTVFLGQIQTAGLGITLTAASTLVFYSLNYSMSDFEQTRARIHRVGQTEPCAYIYLTAKGTVDEKVLKALRDKADLAKTLIDDWRSNKNPFK